MTEPQSGNNSGDGALRSTTAPLSDSSDAAMAETLRRQTAVALDVFAGRVLSHYRLEERLGDGGMGMLYRATDLKLGRAVAIKLLARHLVSDETAKARFIREARAASALDHPNIATIYEIGEEDRELFIAMALYQGETLKQRLKKGRLAVDEALPILRQVLIGLEAAHRAGIVHRDIKPANLLRTHEGIVKILDFGLAKLTSESQATAMTQTGEAMGTVLYMSPEQLRGEAVDGRTDLWSVGVVAYELLAGVNPFQADSGAATAMRILSEEPPALVSVPGVPAWLAEVVAQLLRKAAAERPQSASEVVSRLDRPSSPSPNTAKSRRVLLSAGILAGAVRASFGGWRRRLFARSAANIRSLAVLPLDNFSRDSEQEYFADGMTEELITNLAKIRALRVISRTSVMRYKGERKPLPEIARELNVDAVVEGSVRREGERVRISAQLIHGPTEEHLWAESYERDLKQVLALQSEVALAIAKEIKIRLTPDEQTRLGSARQVNPKAHEAYLKGTYQLDNAGTEEGVKRSREYFEQAIQIDPGYAPAHVELARTYSFSASVGWVPSKEGYAKAKPSYLKALELDPTLAIAHTGLAWIQWRLDWDWEGAEREFKRAIELEANNASTHEFYGVYLRGMGRSQEAVAEGKRAQELDPLTLLATENLGETYFFARQYENATQELRKALEMDPNFAYARGVLGLNYLYQGMYEEGLKEYKKAVELGGDRNSMGGSLAFCYAFMGKKEEARKGLTELLQRRRKYVAPTVLAAIYARLGEKDQAFGWLEKAYEEHDEFLVYLKVNRAWEPLHSDPRFQDLLRRVGLPQ